MEHVRLPIILNRGMYMKDMKTALKSLKNLRHCLECKEHKLQETMYIKTARHKTNNTVEIQHPTSLPWLQNSAKGSTLAIDSVSFS